MANCRGCGRPIHWIEHVNPVTNQIVKVPLDISAPTYDYNTEAVIPRWERSPAKVSHFATCPKANEFSGGKRRTPDELPPVQQSFHEVDR